MGASQCGHDSLLSGFPICPTIQYAVLRISAIRGFICINLIEDQKTSPFSL